MLALQQVWPASGQTCAGLTCAQHLGLRNFFALRKLRRTSCQRLAVADSGLLQTSYLRLQCTACIFKSALAWRCSSHLAGRGGQRIGGGAAEGAVEAAMMAGSALLGTQGGQCHLALCGVFALLPNLPISNANHAVISAQNARFARF